MGTDVVPDFTVGLVCLAWIATILIVASLLGFIAYLAFDKAQPSDVPKVLSGLRDIADRLIWWLGQHPQKTSAAPEDGETHDAGSTNEQDSEGDDQ